MTDERFEVVHREGGALSEAGIRMVLSDRETGVCYLWVWSGNGAGLTPLLDADGRPMVSRDDRRLANRIRLHHECISASEVGMRILDGNGAGNPGSA